MISSPSLFSFGVKMLTTMSFLTTKKLEQLLLILEHSILAFMRFLSRWTFTIDGQLTPYQEKLVCSYPFIDFHYLTMIYLKSINHFISNLINNFLYHLHPRTSFVEWKFLFCSNITIISNEGNGRNCRSWKSHRWINALGRTCKGAPLLNQFTGPITPAPQTCPVDFVGPLLAMATFPNPYR